MESNRSLTLLGITLACLLSMQPVQGVARWEKCSGNRIDGVLCCDDNSVCVKKNRSYSQCRPSNRIPSSWDGDILECDEDEDLSAIKCGNETCKAGEYCGFSGCEPRCTTLAECGGYNSGLFCHLAYGECIEYGSEACASVNCPWDEICNVWGSLPDAEPGTRDNCDKRKKCSTTCTPPKVCHYERCYTPDEIKLVDRRP